MDASLNTLTQDISSTVQNLIDKINSNPLLSALNTLSGAPLHPYDQFKFEIYGPEYKDITFKTLDDIPTPENFVPEQILQTVTDKIQGINKIVVEGAKQIALSGTYINTLFDTISGDRVIRNFEKYKKHIEFIELIKQMPSIDTLSDEQVINNAKKLISEYIKTY